MLLDIICFSHAGGSSLSFYNYIKSAKELNLRIIPIDYPGHGLNKDIERAKCLNELISFIYEKLMELNISKDYILFGHSMGSIVAYELNKLLYNNKKNVPHCLILSGINPKDEVSNSKKQRLYKDLLLKDDNEMFASLNKLIIDDINLIRNYTFEKNNNSNQKIYVLNSVEDKLINPSEEKYWFDISKNIELVKFNGEHNYIYEEYAIRRVLDICSKEFQNDNKEGNDDKR